MILCLDMDLSLDDTANDDEYEQLTAAQVLERFGIFRVLMKLFYYMKLYSTITLNFNFNRALYNCTIINSLLLLGLASL